MRHDAFMDSRALERLGHHVVSRRVALGFRTRIDLASSLQFTVRTLSDIEHGAPAQGQPRHLRHAGEQTGLGILSIDTILAGGEPTEVAATLQKEQPRTPPQARTAPEQPLPAVAGVHRGSAAGAATPRHRPP